MVPILNHSLFININNNIINVIIEIVKEIGLDINIIMFNSNFFRNCLYFSMIY